LKEIDAKIAELQMESEYNKNNEQHNKLYKLQYNNNCIFHNLICEVIEIINKLLQLQSLSKNNDNDNDDMNLRYKRIRNNISTNITNAYKLLEKIKK
jgi:hypothetical protein